MVRCEELGMAEASDEAHLRYATEQERIMVSQDDDFLVLDKECEHAGIMYNPRRYQSEAQVSHLVKQLLFYHEAAEAGAIEYETEIKNLVTYI